ncbi:MAG: Non-ribosomal peptide synthetase component [Rhizobacter sp.]|nr:Non-ribosomal peptide synthetase component [Rhizobacter sp.]
MKPNPDDSFVFPVSFAQRRLWFIDQLVPGSTFYNLHAAVPLRTTLHAQAFERALNEMVRRHESLRTTFVVIDDEPMQRVLEALALAMPLTDLRGLDDGARRQAADEAGLSQAQQPFDLATGPLLRAQLLQLADQDFMLLLTMHHIVSDGWSMGVFWRELTALYNAFVLGRPSPLPELPIQYADFAVWQHEFLRGPALQTQMAYWRRQLEHLPTLDLPTDRPRPTLASYRGAQQRIVLGQALCARLRSLGQQQGTTLFMTLLAAFAALLSRYSAQDDIVVGVPTAGRTRSELEGLIGFFVNTLVMRCDVSGDPPFQDFLQRVKQVALGAYSNQDLPFEKLVEDLQPERDLSRNPLFQVTFQLLSTSASNTPSNTWSDTAAPHHRGGAAFDLSLNLWDSGGEVGGHFEYSTDLFDAATVARLAHHFEMLLQGIVAGWRRRVGELELVDAQERHRLLVDWNRTAEPFPDHQTLQGLVQAQAARKPDQLALVSGEHSVSYRTLDRRANALAHRLRELGVKAGDAVALCLPRGLGLVTAMLGVLKAGAAYAPLDAGSPDERLHLLLDRCEARAVVVDSGSAPRLQPRPEAVLDLDTIAWDTAEADAPPPSNASAGDIACVIFTSGSTGVPKGVEVLQRGLVNLVHWHQRAFALTPQDRATQLAGAGFDACGWELWPCLCTGASVHVVDDTTRLSPAALLAWMAHERITIGFVPTPLAELLLREPMPAGLALRALLTGGDRLHRAPPDGLPFTLHNNYGPTEATVVATSTPLSPRADAVPPIGRPIANTQLYVLDAAGRLAPIGVWGELFIGGAGLARGYRGDPDLTAQRFVDNPFASAPQDSPRLYRSGDLVRTLADGSLAFRGRGDRQVKVRGHRVELGEIENTLLQHPQLREATVALRAGAQGDPLLVAYIVPADDAPDAAVLARTARDFAAERLPDYQVPAAVVVLESLPLTANGKVDLRALPAPVLGDSQGADAAVQGPVEAALAQLFCEVLGRPQVGRHDHFFADLGGHSLLATQLTSRVRGAFDIDLPLRAFFAAPSVSALAAVVEETLIAQIELLSNEDAARLVAQA